MSAAASVGAIVVGILLLVNCCYGQRQLLAAFYEPSTWDAAVLDVGGFACDVNLTTSVRNEDDLFNGYVKDFPSWSISISNCRPNAFALSLPRRGSQAVPMVCDDGARCSGLLSPSGEPRTARREILESGHGLTNPTAALVPGGGFWILGEAKDEEGEDGYVVDESRGRRAGPALPARLVGLCATTLDQMTYVTGQDDDGKTRVFVYKWDDDEVDGGRWRELSTPEGLGLRGRYQRASCLAYNGQDEQPELILVAMKHGERR